MKAEKRRSHVIPLLQEYQGKEGYISREALKEISRLTGLTPNEVFGIASFYAQFRFHPPGRHNIKVCLGTACHVRGGEEILRTFERELGINVGETTKDGEYELERVACLGCCALAPVVVVDGDIRGKVTSVKARDVIKRGNEE